MSVEAIARERRWRDLALPELEAARNANQIGYMTGWAIRDGDDPITLTIALPPWTLTNAMRSRRDAGSPILPPPEPSLRMFGGNVPDFPRRSADQYCDIRFVVNEVEGEAIAAGARQLPFLNETFGNPALGLDSEPVDGLPQSDGGRWWRWSRFHDQIWQRIRFELKPKPAREARSRSIRIGPTRAEYSPAPPQPFNP